MGKGREDVRKGGTGCEGLKDGNCARSFDTFRRLRAVRETRRNKHTLPFF